MNIDKQAHFWWGMAMVGMLSHAVDVWAALGVALLCGFAKELHDEFTGGKADALDFFVTVLGGIVGVMWVGLLSLLA